MSCACVHTLGARGFFMRGVPTTGGGQVGAALIVMRTDEKLRVRYGYPPPPAHSPQLTVHSHVFSLTVRMHEE